MKLLEHERLRGTALLLYTDRTSDLERMFVVVQ